MDRRTYLKTSVVSAAAAVLSREAAANGSVYQQAYEATTRGDSVQVDNRIRIQLPDSVENAAVVPVRIHSTISNTQKMVLLVDNHADAVVASCDFMGKAQTILSVHMRLEVACNVTALVYDGTRWYSYSAAIAELQHHCSGV
ncbi:MAG: thiosulfate oxidation carrier protein SoxY [Gammaproteobacteria bacterium]|nr:thiosulfate oxidation carrier protein SoxY [Gammaproteobacteria bacterium]